jgi:hypothetical protein
VIGWLLTVEPKNRAMLVRPQMEAVTVDSGVMHPLAREMSLTLLATPWLGHFAPPDTLIRHGNTHVMASGSPEMLNCPLARLVSNRVRPTLRIRLVSWIVVVASCRIEEWPAGKWGEAVSRETTGFRLGP